MSWRALTNSSLIVTAGVYAVLFTIAGLAGLFGIWLMILLLASIWRYAYGVLRMLARGHHEIPPPDIESMNPIGDLVLILHMLAFPALLVLIVQWVPFGLGPLGWVFAIVASAVIVLAFPASATLMGMTSNIAAAMNPESIVSVAKTLERDYLQLVAGCAGLCVLAFLIGSVIGPRLGFVSGVLALAVELWALLGMFALMGGSIYEHRHDFDIGNLRLDDDEYAARARERAWRADLDRAYVSIRGGLVAEGYATLRKLVAENGESTEIQHWLVDRMLEWEDRSHGLKVAGRLVVRLLDDGQAADAFDLYRRCRRVSPDFAPPAAALPRLEVYAREIGQHGLADELGARAGVQAAGPRGL